VWSVVTAIRKLKLTFLRELHLACIYLASLTLLLLYTFAHKEIVDASCAFS